jgi:hypothetical protein
VFASRSVSPGAELAQAVTDRSQLGGECPTGLRALEVAEEPRTIEVAERDGPRRFDGRKRVANRLSAVDRLELLEHPYPSCRWHLDLLSLDDFDIKVVEFNLVEAACPRHHPKLIGNFSSVDEVPI